MTMGSSSATMLERYYRPQKSDRSAATTPMMTMMMGEGGGLCEPTPSLSLMERCSQLDNSIKARQQQFGCDLYDLLEEQQQQGGGGGDKDNKKKDQFPNNPYLQQLQAHWIQVNDDIVKYNSRLPQNNKRRRRLRVGSINNNIASQWSLQRKRRFGVDCFDIVFDVLGTTQETTTAGSGTSSLLTKEERQIHALIKKAVQDVLELERTKETIVNEAELPGPCQDFQYCGTLEALCPIYSLCA